MMMMMMNNNEYFETWVSSPPYERCIDKHNGDSMWPGKYIDYASQLASEAWNYQQAKLDAKDAEIKKYKQGYERYETARRMNVQMWSNAFQLNIQTGKPFDQIIDELKPFFGVTGAKMSDEKDKQTAESGGSELNIGLGWKTIGSAPKNGTEILVWNGSFMVIASWGRLDLIGHPRATWRLTQGKYFYADEWSNEIDTPTHWMPLPEPPNEQVTQHSLDINS